MKCGIDNLSLKQIQTSINSALLSYSRAKSKALKEGLPIDSLQSELKQKVFDCYKQIQTGYEVNSDNINSITETIQERFDRYQLGEIDRTFFSQQQAIDVFLILHQVLTLCPCKIVLNLINLIPKWGWRLLSLHIDRCSLLLYCLIHFL